MCSQSVLYYIMNNRLITNRLDMDKQVFVTFAKYLIISIILFNSFSVLNAQSKLKQIHFVFRHGERAPTETYPNDPYINYTWSGGWGHLTNRGKFQMYSLGIKLRKLYSQFIPEYYSQGNVRVLSSYSDRCLMSAEALLAGLFPPKDQQIWNPNLLWQPIAVNYVPRNQDNLIAQKAPCEKYDKEFLQVFQSEEIKKINIENSELYNYLTEQTGQVVDNIGSVELLYNTLEIEILHNLTLPSWTKNVSFTRMRDLAARNLAAFTETDFMKKMKGGVFLKEAINSMKNNDRPSIYLYSAHDLTLVNILRTVRHFDPIKYSLKPGFGASLAIEFYEDYYVKMFYRDDLTSDALTIIIPNCGRDCPLKQFETVYKNILPSDWTRECKE